MTKYFDFDLKENYGVQVCTSATRPTPYDGRAIYETDTGKFLIYNLGTTTWEEISNSGGMNNPATADLDMDNYNIIGADKIIADAATDLTFQVAAGQSFVFQKV